MKISRVTIISTSSHNNGNQISASLSVALTDRDHPVPDSIRLNVFIPRNIKQTIEDRDKDIMDRAQAVLNAGAKLGKFRSESL